MIRSLAFRQHISCGACIAQFYVTVNIHLQRRHVLHYIKRSTTGAHNVFINVESFFINIHFKRRNTCCYCNILQLVYIRLQFYISEVFIECTHHIAHLSSRSI